MQVIQTQVSRTQIISLSEHWQRLIAFIREHPYVTFERLTFENGEPRLGEVEIKETFKF